MKELRAGAPEHPPVRHARRHRTARARDGAPDRRFPEALKRDAARVGSSRHPSRPLRPQRPLAVRGGAVPRRRRRGRSSRHAAPRIAPTTALSPLRSMSSPLANRSLLRDSRPSLAARPPVLFRQNRIRGISRLRLPRSRCSSGPVSIPTATLARRAGGVDGVRRIRRRDARSGSSRQPAGEHRAHVGARHRRRRVAVHRRAPLRGERVVWAGSCSPRRCRCRSRCSSSACAPRRSCSWRRCSAQLARHAAAGGAPRRCRSPRSARSASYRLLARRELPAAPAGRAAARRRCASLFDEAREGDFRRAVRHRGRSARRFHHRGRRGVQRAARRAGAARECRSSYRLPQSARLRASSLERALIEAQPPARRGRAARARSRPLQADQRHFGHLVGDEVLYEVATMITEAVSEEGVVARMGGEEFTVLSAVGRRGSRGRGGRAHDDAPARAHQCARCRRAPPSR